MQLKVSELPSDFKHTQKNDPESDKTVDDNNQLFLLIIVRTEKY